MASLYSKPPSRRVGHLISAKIDADTLSIYYAKLYTLQSDAHSIDYMLVHDEIRKRLDGCDSYTEFGINQGATLAAAMLENPLTVRAYDIKFGWYTQAADLFERYAAEYEIHYGATEISTLDCVIDPVDVLYIDTLHEYEHLTKELARHGDKANRFIIFHDTFAQSGLKRAVHQYVKTHKEWSIVTECDVSVGFMTIEKTDA